MSNPTDFAVFGFTSVPFVSCITQLPIQLPLTNNQALVKRFYFCKKSVKNQRVNFHHYQWQAVEPLQVDWLIYQFNQWFADKNTILVRGEHEPEYFAATDNEPAKIVFAHGFFSSSLHEISHWCVAGKKRRLQNDFGYWYAPDGRNQLEQAEFEKVEIKPQAIECLLTLMCGKKFRVSQDNLSADFDTTNSTFAKDVQRQALHFWQTGEKLPTDAKVLLKNLQTLRPLPLMSGEIK